MKKLIIKFWDKIIVLLLGSSAVLYSCAKYGMLVPEYEINGIVTDKETAKPIQNIRVIRPTYFGADTMYTNAQGKFHSIQQDSPHLIVEDIDGEANGGEFETQEVFVKYTDADLVKKGKRDKIPDRYSKMINIELEKKNAVDTLYGMPSTTFKP